MTHWTQIAFRNWSIKRVRTAGALLAIALGTAAVVWVTCCYESVQQTMLEWAAGYVGNSHITVQSPLGKYDVLPQRIVPKIEDIPGVQHVAPLLVQRLPSTAVPASVGTPAVLRPTMYDVDFHGLDVEREFAVRDWSERLMPGGRMLRPDDENACVLEQSIAEENGVAVGDRLYVWGSGVAEGEPIALEIVGVITRNRIARLQKGAALMKLDVLQELTARHGLINSVEITVKDPEHGNLERIASQIRAAVRVDAPKVLIRSAAARIARLQMAHHQQELVLALLSCVALLTALFIILSTLSMGMIERISQLGLLRCVGVTAGQLAVLVLAEVLPLGVVGIALGVPIGLGLAQATVWTVPEYVGRFVISWNGLWLAVAGGLVTTVIAAVLPSIAATTVSPLEATRARARRSGYLPLLIALAGAAGVFWLQETILRDQVRRDLQFVSWSSAAVVLLYLGYALAAPAVVFLASRVAVPLTAAVVGVRTRLLQDQVGHAVWRSAGICCGLMVGLSMVVGLIVFNESFRSGWQFPKQFPEAYLWSNEQIQGNVAARVAEVPGVRRFTIANAPNVIVEERNPVTEGLMKTLSWLVGATDPTSTSERSLRSLTWFLGIEPDSFFDMVKLEFIEGDEHQAREMLKQGGYVLVAEDFARTRHKGIREQRDADGKLLVSNLVNVFFADRWTTFRIAGVVDSPALDIAASYFQVQSESYAAAVGSVIGTNADLQRLWGIDGARLVLLDFDLPPEPPPPDWPPPAGTPEAAYLTHMHYNRLLPLARRWQNFRETRVLREVAEKLQADVRYGTARELKDEIDSQLTEITYLLTSVPTLALLVAALGVANLMTANVTSRAKQLATMRAVGATRGLVLRLVLGEALVLGMLGGGLGVGLGLHLARNIVRMTEVMWGYQLPFTAPWPFVISAVCLTIGLCIVAGIVPARHASRANVIEALRVA